MPAPSPPPTAVARLGTDAYRIHDRYGSVFLLPPEYRSYVACDGRGSSYHEYDLETGLRVRTIVSNGRYGISARPSVDGSAIVFERGDVFQVAGVRDGQLRFAPPQESGVCGLVLAPDGWRAAVFYRNPDTAQREADGDMEGVFVQRVGFHDLHTGALVAEVRPVANYALVGEFSPDGRLFATTGVWCDEYDDQPRPCEGTPPVQVWDVGTGVEVARIHLPDVPQLAAVFFPDSRRLLLGADWGGSPVGVWDAVTGEQLCAYRTGPGQTTWSHRPTPDGAGLIAFRSWENEVVRRDARTGNVVARTVSPFGQLDHISLKDIAVRADGTVVALQVIDQTVYAWTAPDGRAYTRQVGAGSPARAVGFSADGTEIRTATDGAIRRWAARTGESLGRIPVPPDLKVRLQWVRIGGDDWLVGTIAGYGAYNLVTGASRSTQRGFEESLQSVYLSADGWLIDLPTHVSSEKDTAVRLRHVVEGGGRELFRFDGVCAAASYDRGRVVLTYLDRAKTRRTLAGYRAGSTGAVELWRRVLPVGPEWQNPHSRHVDYTKAAFDRSVPSVQWATDGRSALVIPAPENVPFVIDPETGGTQTTWSDPIRGPLAVHPTRPVLAHASAEGDALVLSEWRTGARLAVVMEQCYPHALAWSPDGGLLVAAVPDGTAWVFDTAHVLGPAAAF